MRIMEMITNLRSLWLSNKFSLSLPQEKQRDEEGKYENYCEAVKAYQLSYPLLRVTNE